MDHLQMTDNTYNKALGSFGYGYTFVSLFDDLRYTTQIGLNGRTLRMTCGYNVRNSLRWISLETLDGTVLLKRTFLKDRRVCELDCTSFEYDLDYYVTLAPKDIRKSFPEGHDYRYWAKDFRIAFVGKPHSSNKEMNRNLLDVLVGE